MSLIDKLFIGGSWVVAEVRGSNTIGTPVTSAVPDGTGEAISDTYVLTVSARAGGTGTVTVSSSSNNPFNGRVTTGVNFDGATTYTEIVPGATIVFAVAGANGNTATIVIGNPYGPFDASGVLAGVPTSGVRHQVVNTGTSDVSGAMAQLLTQVIQVEITNRVFNYIIPFATGATEKTAGGGSNRTMPYALTISAVSGAGPTKIATLNIDGVAIGSVILDLTTGSTVSGVGLKAVTPAYPYRIASGPLAGFQFALWDGVANSDKANVLVFPSRYTQIAPDVGGVEGTYGTADVNLTEVGQAAGVITASGVAYFWTRFLVPSSAINESNPYPCDIALVALQSTGAGWGA